MTRSTIRATRVVPGLRSPASHRFDRNRFTQIGLEQFGVAVVRPPFVGHAIDPASAVPNQQTRFKTPLEGRLGFVGGQLKMLHEDGAIGKPPFAGGGKRDLFPRRIRFARNRNPAQLGSAIRPKGRVQIVGHQTAVRRQALNVSEGTGEREQRWHLAGLALRHS